MENIGVVILTAVVTTILHALLWRFQFAQREKSDYRKLYYKKKLETYEGVYSKFFNEFLSALESTVGSLDEMDDVERLKAQNRLNENAMNILTYISTNSLYMNPRIMNCITDLCSQINIVGKNIARKEVVQPTGISDLLIKVAKVASLIQGELGVREILDSSVMQKVLDIKRRVA